MTTIFKDIGPDTTNGTVNNYNIATSGLTIGLAGDALALYAVSLNAGVWKSVKDGQWMQLAQSPQYAYCCAVDPNNAAHIVVGERDGDAIHTYQNRSGVWESFDAGNSWSYSFDPLSLAGCTSQAIPAVVFSRQSTLFIATSCGIGRKPANASTFDFSSNPVGGQVTALSASESKVWARTPTQLLFSFNDGVTWTAKPIRTTLSVGGTTYNITFGSTGDLFSLAAVDAAAYMFFKPNPDVAGNHNTLLVYNVATDSWTVQVLSSGNGTGLGGRRFIKTFILNRPDLPMVIGQRLQLFLSVAQDMSQATGLNSDGTLQLVDFAHTFGSDAPNHDPIHSDIWDFHIALDGSTRWVTCDGGVYQKSLPAGGWVTYDQGLHTHHIHTLTVLPTGDFSHGLAHSRLTYATSDNDAWFSDTHPTFLAANCCGDANWTDGDTGNPDFVLTARHRENAMLINYRNTPPTRQGITLVNYKKGKDASGKVIILKTIGPDGPTTFRFIQSPKGSAPSSHLDAILMVELPLTFWDGNNNIPFDPNSPLGQSSQGRPVLIRNKQLEANPDINQSKGQGWFIEANNLPAGAQGFYVSGGHDSPVYYAYTGGSGGVLYKRSSPATGWQPVLSGLLIGGQFGPAFVDPYNANRLYVLTPSGVKGSLDGGTSFQDETVLTGLLTGAGKFPLTGNFSGGNPRNVPIASRANAMGTLSHMAFNRDRPGDVVAASPFTGVFYNRGDGTWLDLTASLPQPLSPVSSVGADYTGIYVGTEGRGIFRATTFHSLRLFLESKGVKSVRPLQPTGSISVRSLMES